MMAKGVVEANVDKNTETSDIANNIGDKLRTLRVLLSLSQKEFGRAISVSRATINRLESTGEVSSDMAFRLYYAMRKLQDNVYLDNDIKDECKIMQEYIDKHYILQKSTYSPIAYK